jgi:hypothetical protein
LQRELILNRQRDVVSAVTRFLRRAYPQRLNAGEPDRRDHDAVRHDQLDLHLAAPGWRHELRGFAEEVIAMLEHGLGWPRVSASGVHVVVMGVAGCGKSAVGAAHGAAAGPAADRGRRLSTPSATSTRCSKALP